MMDYRKGFKCFFYALLALFCTTYLNVSFAQTDEADEPPPPPIADPYARFNRAAFRFNESLDVNLMRPFATLYNRIMPKPLNAGIHNFFNNINEIPTIVNDLLQGNFFQAANDSWRLLINTTLGIGGLFDVASLMQLPHYQNDFGLTLVNWGYHDSNYLVLPFYGPYTVRDGIFGQSVDYFAFSIYPHINPPHNRYELYALNVIDRRANLLLYQDVLDEVAIDNYAFVRDAYLQHRAFEIEENKHLSCLEQCPKRMQPT